MYWTTLEISTPRCALMCYPSSNITYGIACLLCIGVILLNKFNSIQFDDQSCVIHRSMSTQREPSISQIRQLRSMPKVNGSMSVANQVCSVNIAL